MLRVFLLFTDFGSTSDTKMNLVVRLQFQSNGVCGLFIHFHYCQIHFNQFEFNFQLLTVGLALLCYRMARSICRSANVIFFILTADQSLIGAASRGVDGWDRTIKIIIKSQTPRENYAQLCNNNNIYFCEKKSLYIHSSFLMDSCNKT